MQIRSGVQLNFELIVTSDGASARMASSSRKTGSSSSRKKRLTLRGSQVKRSSQSGEEEGRGVEGDVSNRVRTEDNRAAAQSQAGTDHGDDVVEQSLCPTVSSPGLPPYSVASPDPSQNLTVTYCYVHSPINCSTRSLSELASALPSDGATLRSRHMESSPSPPPSPHHSSLPLSPSFSRPVRKKLRSETDSPHSADIQRLLDLASRLRHTPHDSPAPLPPPPSSSSPPTSSEQPMCTHVESEQILINAHHTAPQQLSLEPSRDVGGCDGNQHPVTGESCEDDEAFWSQAADVVEERGWEGGEGGGEGDSAFIDDLLSSGLVMTPKAPLTFSPHTSHHSTPHTHHPSSCTTPLSHRQPESRRTHPLF